MAIIMKQLQRMRFDLLGKSALQILPIAITPVSRCAYMYECMCVSSLHKRVFPDS